MKRLLFALLLLPLGVAAPAHAQITNFLPGGEATKSVPEVRLTGDNAVADRARALAAQQREAYEKRRPVIEAEIAALDTTIAALEEREKKGQPVLDLKVARQLRSELKRELTLHDEAASVADEAYQRAQQEPTAPDGVLYLSDVLKLQLEAATLHQQASASALAAEQIRALASMKSVNTTAGTLQDRLDAQEARLQSTEADVAQAKSLLATANAENASAIVGLALRNVQIPQEDLLAAAAELEAREQELDSTRKVNETERLEREAELSRIDANTALSEDDRSARRGLIRAQITRIDRTVQAAELNVLRAEVRLAATRYLAGEAPDPDPVLQISALETQRRGLMQARDALRVEAQRVRPATERELRKSIDQITLSITRLEEALAWASLAQHGDASLSRMNTPLRWLLTALLALVALGVYMLGSRLLHRLTVADGVIARRFKLEGHVMAQVGIGVGALWFFTCALGAIAIAIWWVWDLDISLVEAITKIDHPIIRVDERGISVFSLVKFGISIFIAVMVSRWIRRALTRRIYPVFELDAGLTNALNTLIKYTLVTAGVLIGFYFVGIGLGSLAFFAGILGIGIGFGLRNIAENFISGLMILAERPIQIGDWIDLDGQVEGQVRDIRARATRLVTRSNISVIIPNSEFIGNRVTNWSHGDPRVRVDINVSVAYGSDVQLVRKTLREVAESHGKVLKKPTPEVQFHDFGNSSLDFNLLVWIEEQDSRFRIASDLRFAIDAAFRRKGIEIPFPQRDLHVRTMDTRFAAAVGALLNPGSAQANGGLVEGEEKQPTEEAPLPKTAAAKKKQKAEEEAAAAAEDAPVKPAKPKLP